MTIAKGNFWQGKKVVITGHTGFKGGWMALWLSKRGAHVTGIGLAPETSFYDQIRLGTYVDSHICDIRHRDRLPPIFNEAAPDIVIHMAAQSLVQRSCTDPLTTFETNLMGTLNVMDAVAHLPEPPAATLIITSDKVYRNEEDGHIFDEQDPLGGDDPYSASKACVELASNALRHTFHFRMATARAGNVIGGGDFAGNRLIPDIIRAWQQGTPLSIRAPSSIRPWQHVLDSIAGYLVYAEALASGIALPPALNFGPEASTAVPVSTIIAMMETSLGCSLQRTPSENRLSEKKYLQINAALAHQTLGWQPRLALDMAIHWTADWYKAHHAKEKMDAITLDQICAFERLPP